MYNLPLTLLAAGITFLVVSGIMTSDMIALALISVAILCFVRWLLEVVLDV